MARSINEWFGDHAEASLGDSQDDEVVEAHAPWDVAGAGMTTTRASRKALGFGSGRTSKVRRAVGASAVGRSSRVGKSAKKQRSGKTAPVRSGAMTVESQIR